MQAPTMTEAAVNISNNISSDQDKKPNTKEKLQSIMIAASALTALGDEESEAVPGTENLTEKCDSTADGENSTLSKEQSDSATPPKRFLPEHKKPDAAPTFPEKLMSLMRFADKQENCSIAWLDDGKSFVIRNPDEFTRQILPKYFKATKFSSFTRKLYRWGFRQINRGIGPDDPIIFGNEHFQRDSESSMAMMRSITAAGTRKAEQTRSVIFSGAGVKRQVEDQFDVNSQKRLLFDQLLQQNSSGFMGQSSSIYGGMNPNGTLPLTSALRTNGGMGVGQNTNLMQMNSMNLNNGNLQSQSSMMPLGNSSGIKPYDFMNQSQFQSNGLMNQYMPPNMMNGGQFPNPQSTAEIVNAAIAALRYAN